MSNQLDIERGDSVAVYYPQGVRIREVVYEPDERANVFTVAFYNGTRGYIPPKPTKISKYKFGCQQSCFDIIEGGGVNNG